MGKAPLLAAGIALFALGAGSFAETLELRFSRPRTGFHEFQRDQILCQRLSAAVVWRHGGPNSMGPGRGGMQPYRDPKIFIRCMVDKGYQLDPSGYRTGQIPI